MQVSPRSTSPSWNESDSFRETTLHLFDDLTGREAVRHMSRVLHVIRRPAADCSLRLAGSARRRPSPQGPASEEEPALL